jgi:hypothetical protein
LLCRIDVDVDVEVAEVAEVVDVVEVADRP